LYLATLPDLARWNEAPRFLMRDRDGIYGGVCSQMLRSMTTPEVLTAPRSPWQNPFVERVIGSTRRECLDHVIIWNERGLRRYLRRYVAYDHQWRTHLSLDEDSSLSRATEIPNGRPIVAVPCVGGLHHHDERLAA
jgi:putative transposase